MAPVPACICADTLSACPWSESKAPVERPSATAPLPGMIIARATIMAASCARHFLVRSFIVFLLVAVTRPVRTGPLPAPARDAGGVSWGRRHDWRLGGGESPGPDPAESS